MVNSLRTWTTKIVKKLTKDDISFEAQVEICDTVNLIVAVFTDKHVDICTCHTVNNFLFANPLDFLRFPRVWRYFVVESVGAGLASVWLLDSTDDKIKRLLAHLFLQIGQSLFHDVHDCLF